MPHSLDYASSERNPAEFGVRSRRGIYKTLALILLLIGIAAVPAIIAAAIIYWRFVPHEPVSSLDNQPTMSAVLGSSVILIVSSIFTSQFFLL